METHDLIVIGAGPGGYVAAIRGAQLGLNVAIVEKRETLGGTCLNVGCIPSKAMLESSELYHLVSERASEFGVEVGETSADVPAMVARKAKIVDELTGGLVMLMKKNKITVLSGTGALRAAGQVTVTDADGATTELSASSIVLATGSAPVELPFMKFDGERIVSSTEALCFDAPPERLVVIGAGAVGLELGSVWARLGSQVTVVEMLPQITPFADTMMAKMLQRSLAAQGLDIRLKTQVTAANVEGDEVKLSLKNDKGEDEELVCDRVLVAVGRRPYSDGLGLDAAGIATDDARRVPINERFETSLKGVYAIGDLVAGPMLAHKAEDEGVAVAEIIAGKPGHVNYDAIPNVVYTWPELAAVGMTEAEAKAAGHQVNVGRFSFKGNGRAKTMSEDDGMAKIVADAKTDRVLGVHIVGPRASDMIAEAGLAVEFRASAEDIARTSHAHPTLAEVLKEAALAVDKRAIHA